jgi:predicted RNA methylase
MKYQLNPASIPQTSRAEINEKILTLIQSTDMQGITAQDVFDAYTGVGGLHGLSRADYKNYSQFSDAKKEIEQGQFFTPGQIIEQIAQLLQVGPNEFICDLTCGAGAFFNSFPERQCYGCELDLNAFTVAKFLYPEANLTCGDIKYYRPDIRFDYVVGNPPFNLEWKIDGDTIRSQLYFCRKAAELLKPGGLMICIVPRSFLADEFFNAGAIADLNKDFNFMFQYYLEANAFAGMGVDNFETKVICFQRRSEHLGEAPYMNLSVTYEEAKMIIVSAQVKRHELKVKLQAEFLAKNERAFVYKLNKYLYEIKTHKVLKPHLTHAMEIIEKFRNQKRPAGMTEKEWEHSRLKEGQVLSSLRRIIKKQHIVQVDKILPVKTQYGFKLKPYSNKAKAKLNKQVTHVSIADTFGKPGKLHYLDNIIGGHPGFKRLMRRKNLDYDLHVTAWEELDRVAAIDQWLGAFTFVSPKDKKAYHFSPIQLNDMGLILQKKYAILNWQQGSGKSSASYAWSKYKPAKNTFIIGPALAMQLTWKKFMKVNDENFIYLKRWDDINKIKPGQYVLCSIEFVRNNERHLKVFIKRASYKINLVFDESDEITNDSSKKTRAVLNCFRKVKRKLLATGTTTRNNITELYSQLELLYNNSYNMLCICDKYYLEETLREKDCLYPELAGTRIVERSNEYFGEPFPAFYGATLFKRCFNPATSSVFGIQKHNQDIYNEGALRGLIGQAILTRKFKDLAGDRYTIHTAKVQQTIAERHVYKKIIRELQAVIPSYFSSTGNSRKDSMLNIIRQLSLLIKATSMPQSFPFYHGSDISSKAEWIRNWTAERNCKVLIGCTSIDAVNYYGEKFSEWFPDRKVFIVIGETSFAGRRDIISDFEATDNGIVVCTQQSLKSSVNIPSCNEVLLESLQWNIPKMEQFYFRAIRYDSTDHTNVWFVNYENTIEMNLLALLMAKEKLNDYIKTLEYRDDSDIYSEFNIDMDILNGILTREVDDEGNYQINWGNTAVA